MKFKYLIVSPALFPWGKDAIDKQYLVRAVQRGDLIINLDEGTYFDADDNAWLPLKGDA